MAKLYIISNKNSFDSPSITVKYTNTSVEDLGIDDIDSEIRACEEIAASITLEFSKIDQSIARFRESYRSTSDKFFDLGDVLSTGINEKNLEKNQTLAAVSLISSSIGLLVRAAGGITSLVKEYQADKKRKEAQDILLEKKQEIARSKMASVVELRNQIHTGIAAKARLLYEKEGNKIYDSQTGEMQLKLYKKLFTIILRYNNVIAAIDTIIEEMKAWLAGKHDGKAVNPAIIEDEINLWSGKENMDNYISRYLNKDIPLPTKIVLLLSEPALTRQFVGIDCPLLACDNPLILFGDGPYTVENPKALEILETNQYFKECQNNLSLYGYDGEQKIHTSLADWLMMSAFIIVPMAIMVGICAIVEGDFWRVLIGVGLIGLIKYIELDIFDLPIFTYPIEKKIKKETERYKDYLKTIYDRDKKSYDKYNRITL